MLLIVEIGLTIAICILWHKSGKGWAWGCLPGILLVAFGFCYAISMGTSGMDIQNLASYPVWPDILGTIVLLIMLFAAGPAKTALPPNPPQPPTKQ
jgi:hypothetical protein